MRLILASEISSDSKKERLIDEIPLNRHRQHSDGVLSCQYMATLTDLLAAYRIYAQAEGKSEKTIRAVTQAVTYFSQFVGNTSIDRLTSVSSGY